MSYIGLDPNVPLLNTSTDFFSGNGVNKQFTLSRNVASPSDLDVLVGTTAQRPQFDYDAQGTVLIFNVAPVAGTNNVTVTYRAGALNSLNLQANAFPAGTEGAPSVYSVAANNTGLYWANASSISVTVSGADKAVFNANVDSTNINTGAFVVEGGVGLSGNLYTGGQVRIEDTTQSGNASTGALVVSGGAGILANLNVAGNIVCVGDFTVNGTFSSTGTESLDVADPFIFLANANPGDTVDSGVITQFFDGSTNRYAGYFRDVTDGKFKFFSNLTVRPTNVVSTGDASFRFADLLTADLTSSGNVTANFFIGDGSQLTGISTDTTQIFNSNSRVRIASPNGNIVNNVNGITVTTVSSTGLTVTGLISASGNIVSVANIQGANLLTTGSVSSTGNITSAANIAGGNAILTGQVTAVGNITGGNLRTAGLASVTGNIDGGNIRTPGVVSASGQISAGGNVTGENFNTAGQVSAAGNIQGGNLTTGIITSNSTISATGTISGGNISTVGTVSAVGNIIGNFILGNGALLTGIDTSGISNGTSNVRVLANSNVTIQVGGSANLAVFSTGGISTTGTVNATGNIIGGNLNTNGLISSAGNVIGGNLTTTGAITTTGNVVGGNVNTSGDFSAVGLVTATGNVRGGNIVTGGLITAVGGISAANLTVSGPISGATTIGASGTATVGNLATTGSVTAGSGGVSATGNVTGGNLITGGLISSTGNITSAANVAGGNAIIGNAVLASSLSVSGNITANNAAFTNIVTAATAPVDTNTTQVATTAYVIAQASSASPAAINSSAVVGTSTRYARADHTHAGVATLATSGTGISVNASTGAITITSNANSGNSANTLVARDANGSFSANIITATVSGAATTAGTVTTAAQPNITSVGTLSSVSVTGNVQGGNLRTAGLISATGGVTAASFAGNARALFSLDAGNLDNGTVPSARLSGTYTITVSGAATTAGTVTTAAQPNITSVGTLTALTVTGNTTSGNLLTGGLVSATGGVTAASFTGNGRALTSIDASNLDNGTVPSARLTGSYSISVTSATTAGTVTTAAQPNITSVGTLSSVSVTGNVQGGNLRTAGLVSATGGVTAASFTGNGRALTSIDAGNLDIGTLPSARLSGTYTITVSGAATTAGTVTTAAQPNITSVGTLTALTVTGNITGGNLITAGLVSLSSIAKTGSNGVGNIGSSSNQFDTAFVKATSAQYADLAEMYSADKNYQPGTVLDFGGSEEVTLSVNDNSSRIAGVVSTQPAYLMNSHIEVAHPVSLALIGRVPCLVKGPIQKGDMLVSAGDGRARAQERPEPGTVIGKALENFSGDIGVIEVVVGKL